MYRSVPLCAPYNLLMISNKFWMGRGGKVGSRRGPGWRGRIIGVEGLRGGVGSSAVMLLYCTLHFLGLTLANICVIVYAHVGLSRVGSCT
jgi:hypothetical protein